MANLCASSRNLCKKNKIGSFLLNYFGSARAVESASLDELKSIDGIEISIAKKIHNFFHS